MANKKRSVWDVSGKDKSFEHYRLSDSITSKDLRRWVDNAYFDKHLDIYLDKNFASTLQNEDFYGRIWELELAEWFQLSNLKMIPTHGIGPDFCIELSNGKKVWVEAVLSRPDTELEQIWKEALSSEGSKAYNTPRKQTALRYSSSLVGKANKIRKNYSKIISSDDYTLIAISAFPPSSLRSDIDLFMLAILPIDNQVVYFSQDGDKVDDSKLPTHTILTNYTKKSGSKVKKEFLYPGSHFPFIDGVVFSEASNLQQLLGTLSSRFDETTNRPHVFENYAGKPLPNEFTKHFYFHKFNRMGDLIGIEMVEPIAD